MNNVVKLPQAQKKDNSDVKSKEVRRVDINNIIRFSEVAKRSVLHGSSIFLTAIAVIFASAACVGHLYEPEVPEKLK